MIVPFRDHVGIKEGVLVMSQDIQNHLGSIHAGAQYTFAENASGEYLLSLFSRYKEDVIPLLREGVMQYKKEATSMLYSQVLVQEEAIEKFMKNLEMKNRAIITAEVKLFDQEDEIVSVGSFKWFVQKRH